MRRLAVVSLAPMAAAVLALTGCDSGGSGSAVAGASAGTGASPNASARPVHSISPNARKACDQINQAIADGAAAFGTDLGSVAGHLAGGNKAQADKAKSDALKRLTDLAAKIRTIAATSDDPAVRTAAQNTASALAGLATDPELLGGITSAATVAPVIERVTRATDAMNSVCV